MKKLTFMLCILLFQGISYSTVAVASPLINTINGAFNHGKYITITGTAFGTKSPAKPLIWMPFEGEKIDVDASLSSGDGSIFTYSSDDMETSSADLPHSRSSYALRGIPWDGKTKRSGAIRMGVAAGTDKIYMFNRRKNAHDRYLDGVTNYKTHRFWPQTLQYTNFILSFNNYGTKRTSFTNEGTTSTTAFSSSYVAPNNVWFQEEVQIFHGDIDVKNATAQYWLNGKSWSFPGGAFIGRTTKNPDIWYQWYLQNHWTNTAPNTYGGADSPPAGAYVYFDDIYADITWSRVMVGNASNFSACTHREPLIPTAWSNTSITAYFNQGSFPNGSKVYLFVVDSNGNASPGKEIAIGGTASAGDVPKPTVNPNPPVKLIIN